MTLNDQPRVEHGTVQLPDGRHLAYSDGGEGEGVTVLYVHGNPGSRTEILRPAYLKAFRRAKLRVVTVDRPGFGDSDPPRETGHAAFVDDIRHLLDQLQLAEVVVTGASRGALPSLALAALLPERIRAVGLFGPTGLPDDPDLLKPLHHSARLLLTLVKHLPSVARLVLHLNASLDRVFPASAIDRMALGVPSEPDRKLLREVGQEWVDALAAGMRRDPGFSVDDWRSWLVDPLGFQPGSITAPVLLWTGDEDGTCPPAQSAYMASRMPTARRSVLKGHGHLHTPATLADLMQQTLDSAHGRSFVRSRPD